MTVDLEMLEILAEGASKGEWKAVAGPMAAIDIVGPGSVTAAPGGTVYTSDPEDPKERQVVATYTYTTENARYLVAVQPRVVQELCTALREARDALIRYGQHDSDCLRQNARGNCTCGLHDAIRKQG